MALSGYQNGGMVILGGMKMKHDLTQISSEAYRLKTFRTWPVWSPMDPKELAKAGFYYIGVGDKTRCFSCHGDLEDWKDGDIAMGEHKKFYPGCPFLNGIGKRNKPLPEDKLYSGCKSSTGSDETDSSGCSGDDSSPLPKHRGNLCRKEYEGLVQLENYVKTSGKGNGYAIQREIKDARQHVSNPKGRDEPDGMEEYVKGVKSELYRLRTFDNWPRTSPLRPSELAQAGFFYLGFGDRVQCFACRGQIQDWEYIDTAMGEHKRHFPQCPFVRMLQGHYVPPQIAKAEIRPRRQTRAPKEQSRLHTERRTPEKKYASQREIQEKRRVHRLPATHKNLHKIYVSSSDEEGSSERPVRSPSGDVAVTPRMACKHPRYAAVNARLDTFMNRDCPLRLNRRGPTPQSLASAGFFYAGENDVCCCFHCGVSLRGWGPATDPWAEHAMWYPTCEWLGMRKTKAFIQSVGSCTTTPADSLSETENMEKLVITGKMETTARKEITSKEHQRSKMETTARKPKEITSNEHERSTSPRRLVPKGIAKETKRAPDTDLCKVCLDKRADTVFLPCKHLATCGFCACSLDQCIICRQEIRDCVYTFQIEKSGNPPQE